MRPGLVAVGVGFLLLGAGAVGAFLLVPSRGVTSDDATVIGPVSTPPGSTAHAAVLTGTTTGTGSFGVHWISTGPTVVDLYDASNCPLGASNCPLGMPIAAWPSNDSGHWNESGALAFPLLLTWRVAGTSNVTFQASSDEQWTTSAPPPMLTTLLVFGSGGVLAAVGAVAVFLGLFLRTGVYQGPPRLVSRSADDVESIAGGPPRERPRSPR
ncbi:MAG: hypothetical protein L3K19_05795 [Thermoplasmata archaeon]|nr:hypothetical protein [Thermoplasmata archaeon]